MLLLQQFTFCNNGMMRLLLVLTGFVLFSSLPALSQSVAGDYRSHQTGTWENVNTWEIFDGASWVYPSTSIPNTSNYAGSNVTTILSGHTITVTANETISLTTIQTSGAIIINVGTTLSLNEDFSSNPELSVSSGATVTVAGTLDATGLIISPLSVDGTISSTGTVSSNSGSEPVVLFNANSTYNHQNTSGGAIPLSTWDVNSTCVISGLNVSNPVPPSNLNQQFGNFTWNCTAQGSTSVGVFSLGGQLTDVQGTLTFQSSNNKPIRLDDTSAGYTMSVGVDFINHGVAVILTSASTSVATIISVTRDFIQTGGSTVFKASSNFDVTLQVGRNFSKTSGAFAGGSGTGIATLSFTGSTVQTYTVSGTALSNINYNVANLAIVDLGTSAMTGAGSLTLNPSSTLKVGSVDASGAIQNAPTAAGNIQVSGTRTYSSSATIVYDGAGPQVIGNGFPSNVNLEIANTATAPSNTVTNNNVGVTNVVGNLTLTSGALYIGSSNTLNVQSNFIVTAGMIGGSATSNLTFSGSGSLGTLNFASGAASLNNLTISRSGTVVLGSSLTVGSTIALNNGNLNFSGFTLTMNGGSISSSSNGLISNSTSNLVFGGSTYSGAVPFSGSSNQLNNLTFSTPGGTFIWNSAVIVNSNLNLTAGSLTHTSGITMAANSTINMGGGSISGTSPTAASSYNVNYTANGNTGLELPLSSTALNNLTIASSGTVSLTSNGITINGTLLISGGTFSTGSNSLTMKGGSWSIGSGGTFLGGTGIVSIGGNTTVGGAGTISFSNLTTLNGSTLTLPFGTVSLTGDLNLNAGSTFNNGGGTIILDGSGSQTVTGAGKSFSNLTVNKTGGIVDVLPTLNLTGVLTLQSSTTLQSNGNLVLISTSDGTSGTASIAAIPTGASVTGNVVVQRYISAKGRVYHDISPPVQSATVQQIMSSGITVTGFTPSSFPCAGCATNNPSMYWYDETVAGVIANGYTAMTAAGQTMSSGRGYNVLVRNEVGAATMALTGVINSGPLTLPVSFTNSGNPSADGWNFVGNPYPSSIDWGSSSNWTKSQILGNMISVWDAGANQYKTWNGATGSLGSGIIGQGQGFWFQCSATPTLNITESAKASSTGSFLREMSQPIHTVELILRGASVEDRTYVQQVNGSTTGFDAMDGPKLTIDNFSLSTVVDNSRNVAINAVGEILLSGKMPLFIANIDEGDYTFTQQSLGDFQGVKISILDKYTNAIHDLSNGASYTFTFQDKSNSRTTDRFVLLFGDNTDEFNQLSLYPNPVSKTLAVYINSDQMPQGEVIDVMGRPIGIVNWAKAADGPSWTGTFDMQSQSTGVYFVKVNLKDGAQVKRFLKN